MKLFAILSLLISTAVAHSDCKLKELSIVPGEPVKVCDYSGNFVLLNGGQAKFLLGGSYASRSALAPAMKGVFGEGAWTRLNASMNENYNDQVRNAPYEFLVPEDASAKSIEALKRLWAGNVHVKKTETPTNGGGSAPVTTDVKIESSCFPGPNVGRITLGKKVAVLDLGDRKGGKALSVTEDDGFLVYNMLVAKCVGKIQVEDLNYKFNECVEGELYVGELAKATSGLTLTDDAKIGETCKIDLKAYMATRNAYKDKVLAGSDNGCLKHVLPALQTATARAKGYDAEIKDNASISQRVKDGLSKSTSAMEKLNSMISGADTVSNRQLAKWLEDNRTNYSTHSYSVAGRAKPMNSKEIMDKTLSKTSLPDYTAKADWVGRCGPDKVMAILMAAEWTEDTGPNRIIGDVVGTSD